MSFIVVADGREISMRHAATGDITSFSIAWSLSQINRFTGHARRPYSVAEHSLLVCEILERDFQLDAHGLMAGLMHDAHESVCGDMHSPGKHEIGAEWYRWEHRWERHVRSAFGLHVASTAHRDAIHRADLIALATEKRDLMPESDIAWPVLAGIQPAAWVDLFSDARRVLIWEDWRDRFLSRFHQLDLARHAGQLRNRVDFDAPTIPEERAV
jgi:uncharacterized protein